MQARELIQVLYNKELLQGDLEGLEITSCVNDTRQITPGACFVAIQGQRFDGHQALAEAVELGAQLLVLEYLPATAIDLPVAIVQVPSTVRAQAILAHQFYHQPSHRLNVVAVTGTNGKSTITTMVNDLLMFGGRTTGLIGTIQYKVADRIYPPLNTTPNAMELQAYFHEMVQEGCQDALIEASSHALTLGRLWQTEVDVAIYTNLSREHLDFHQTMDQYAQAKSLLFSQLGQGFQRGRPKLAIINQDAAYSDLMMNVTSAEVLTYSLKDPQATAYADQIQIHQGHLHFNLHYQDQTYAIHLPMAGRYNAENYMAAFLTLVTYYAWSPEQVLEATRAFQGVTGRMQSIVCGQDFEVVVDFAHTPDAIRGVLSELSESLKPGQELHVLIGHSGGNRDSGARPEIGQIVFQYADRIVFTADNPRHESVAKITEELVGDHEEDKWILVEDRQEAIRTIMGQAQSGDLVVCLGKGGEPYQVLGDDYIPYREEEVVRATLRDMMKDKED